MTKDIKETTTEEVKTETSESENSEVIESVEEIIEDTEEIVEDKEVIIEDTEKIIEDTEDSISQDETEAPDLDQEAGVSVYDDEGEAKWYVVHTYSGHENKVKVNIEKIVENRGMQDLIIDIIVPTEDHVELKDGQRKVKTRKMFPGYVLVKMIVTNESWYLVRNTQGVTGFVGHGSEPIPLTKEEVRRMGIEKVYIDLDINVGDSIKVINGPFESFMGVVEEVNAEKQTLKARISMFGRDTPVELVYDQVDKI